MAIDDLPMYPDKILEYSHRDRGWQFGPLDHLLPPCSSERFTRGGYSTFVFLQEVGRLTRNDDRVTIVVYVAGKSQGSIWDLDYPLDGTYLYCAKANGARIAGREFEGFIFPRANFYHVKIGEDPDCCSYKTIETYPSQPNP